MCKVLKELAIDIFKMDYQKQESGKNYEERICTLINNKIKKYDLYKFGCYVKTQPNGSQRWPDFHLCGWNMDPINIECKRTTTGGDGIMWNEGIPRPFPGCIYIFSSEVKKQNIRGTTMFLGPDVITLNNYEKIQSFKKDSSEYVKYGQLQFKDDMWIPNHLRLQCKVLDPYILTHPQRKHREVNVVNFLDSLTIREKGKTND